MTSSLDAVYEKYKHLDGPLSDTEWCTSGEGAAIYAIAGELWRAVKEARENPCTENGCTDIENCDEICQHSRIYSPVQMQQAIAQARVDVIYEILKDFKFSCPGGEVTPICDMCGANKYCVELHLAQPEPKEREPE